MKKVEASEYRVEEDYMLYGKIDLVLEDENNIISNLSFSDINTAINEEKKIFNLLK